MTNKSLEMLKWLLEDLETDEGVCYKTRSSTCATACPLWYAGAFGDNNGSRNFTRPPCTTRAATSCRSAVCTPTCAD